MNNYKNELNNVTFTQVDVLDMGFMLYPQEGFNNCEKAVEGFKKAIEGYSDYINDKEKFLQIFKKIKRLDYINLGYREEDKWKFNEHRFFINDILFTYKTGVGINLKEDKNNNYTNYYKLIIDAICCFLSEANISLNYSEGEFLEEFGYLGKDSLKEYNKGKKAYFEILEGLEKCKKIWDIDTIKNINDIIEL